MTRSRISSRLRIRTPRPGGWLLLVAILIAAGPLRAQDGETPGPSPSPSDTLAAAEQESAAVVEPGVKGSTDCCKRRCCRPRLGARLFSRCRRTCGDTEKAAPVDPYAWRSLFDGKTLDGWKAPEFGGEGKVTVEDGAIVMAMGGTMTGVTYTGEVLRESYELELEGKKIDGNDFFCTTTFPVGKDPCSLVVGGWGGTVVGLSNVDYYDASDNLTTTFHEFNEDQWYKVRIRVTAAAIEAWIDDERVVNQERKEHKFDIRLEVDLCVPLGVSTYMTAGAIRNIRVRQLPPDIVGPEPDEE